MNPITVIAAVNAGLALVEALLPLIRQMKLDGQISEQQQQELLARYNAMKIAADAQFSGPEWIVE